MKAVPVIKVSPIHFHSIKNAVSVEHGYLGDQHLLFAPQVGGRVQPWVQHFSRSLLSPEFAKCPVNRCKAKRQQGRCWRKTPWVGCKGKGVILVRVSWYQTGCNSPGPGLLLADGLSCKSPACQGLGWLLASLCSGAHWHS